MTPQSSFMVVARIGKRRIEELRSVLQGLNFPARPGNADPSNPLIPFGAFERLHFARFVILDDATTADVAIHGLEPPDLPIYLAFLGDIDGAYSQFVEDLARVAGPGLRTIFTYCDDFSTDTNLVAWMRDHEVRPAAFYCNRVGRTVRQCLEEAELRRFLTARWHDTPSLHERNAEATRVALRRSAQDAVARGHLVLTPEAPTPLRWKLRRALEVLATGGVMVAILLSLPIAIPLTLMLLWKLRQLERTDPELALQPTPEHVAKLAAIEDYGVTNQFSAMGSLKPGIVRRLILQVALLVVDWTCRFIYNAGRLARVHTIHFARWVYLDGSRRLFFASNYDGSLESYMDDFINKVAFGLNVVFSNGVGYPPTDWLILRGAKHEQHFKYFIRRHQLPTEVWYNACAGLTNLDLARNSLIRSGLETSSMSEQAASAWLALL